MRQQESKTGGGKLLGGCLVLQGFNLKALATKKLTSNWQPEGDTCLVYLQLPDKQTVTGCGK